MSVENLRESRFKPRTRPMLAYAISDRDDNSLSKKKYFHDGTYMPCITDKCNGTARLNGNGNFHCNVCPHEFSLKKYEKEKKEKPRDRYIETVRKKLDKQKRYALTEIKKDKKKE